MSKNRSHHDYFFNASLLTTKQLSCLLVQQEIYNVVPIMNLYCILSNLVFVSFICSSVTGESFSAQTKEIGREIDVQKSFQIWKTMFITYWSWSKDIKTHISVILVPRYHLASQRRDRLNWFWSVNLKDCLELSLLV